MNTKLQPIKQELIEQVGNITTKDKLSQTLMQLNPDAWDIAQLRTKGWTPRDIYLKYDGVYSYEDISYMIKQVVACNKAVAIENPEMLRQLLLDELDSYKRELLANTGGVVDEKVFNALIKQIEVRAKLLGLNAPEVQKIDISTTIKSANETLLDKLNSWKKSKAIDVTPVEEETNT